MKNQGQYIVFAHCGMADERGSVQKNYILSLVFARRGGVRKLYTVPGFRTIR